VVSVFKYTKILFNIWILVISWTLSDDYFGNLITARRIETINTWEKLNIAFRAVKSCQKTQPGNRSRQNRLTVYT